VPPPQFPWMAPPRQESPPPAYNTMFGPGCPTPNLPLDRAAYLDDPAIVATSAATVVSSPPASTLPGTSGTSGNSETPATSASGGSSTSGAQGISFPLRGPLQSATHLREVLRAYRARVRGVPSADASSEDTEDKGATSHFS
jgi:hypothetical protein